MDILSHVSGVYIVTCSVSGKVYIGSSYDARARCSAHRNMLRKGVHHNCHLQAAWNKYGEDAFVFCLVEEVGRDRLLEREQYWIGHYRSCDDTRGYNISIKAGAPMAGLRHSLDTKIRFSEERKGARNGNYKGPNCSCCVCGAAFRRYARDRKYCSQECYHADASRWTPALRRKMGNANRGKALPRNQVDKSAQSRMQEYIVTDPDGNEYRIKGLGAFCREHGLDQGSMSHVIRGRQVTHKGWKCRKYDE